MTRKSSRGKQKPDCLVYNHLMGSAKVKACKQRKVEKKKKEKKAESDKKLWIKKRRDVKVKKRIAKKDK